MKNKSTLINLVVISVALIVSSCANKTEEICDCLKKAANTYMVKGEKASEQDLMKMCNQFEGALKGASVDDKRIVETCLDTVKKHIEDKVLFTDIEDVKLTPLPCGEDFVKEINLIIEDKVLQDDKNEAMAYYLIGRNLSCSMVVDYAVTSYETGKPTLYEGMLRVTGKLYANSEIGEGIELLMPEKEYNNIKKAVSACDIKKGQKRPLLTTYRQIIKFSGKFYQMPGTALGGVVFMFKADTYEYVKPNIKTETANNEGQSLFAYEDVQVSENSNNNNDVTETSDASYSDVIGTWKGQFGQDELTLNIETFDFTHVTGYSSVKNNNRELAGTFKSIPTGYSMVLNEPGDDKWDGVFTVTYNKSTNKLEGEWTANSGKANKKFILTKEN